MNRRWRVPLAAVLVLLLAACDRPADEVIRFGLAAAPANLDPRFATDAASARINRLLYARLVDFDPAFRPVPALADWEALTPVHYRFRLRPGRAPFHDGRPLTAADVAATYRSILEPGSGSPHRGVLALVREIIVRDEDTLDFHLDRADPLFPGYLAIGIVPAAAIAAARPLHREPLGSGAFRLRDWPQPDRLRLERLADGQPVEFLRIADPTVRVLKLLRGEIDLLQNDLPFELLDYLDRQADIRLQFRPGTNFAYLGFNLRDAATGRLAVREAIACAIDRPAIIEHLLGGRARPAAALLPPGHWAGHPGLVPGAHDPDCARERLARAGYGPGRPLRLHYKTSTDPLRVRIATVIQQQLADAGIEMSLSSYDWGTFYGDIKAGRFQVYSLAWVGIKTPDIFRYAFHSESLPPGGANRGRLADAAVDALIESAESAATLAAQAADYRAVQARLLEKLVYIPLWYEDHFVASRETIRGYWPGADGNYDTLASIRVDR